MDESRETPINTTLAPLGFELKGFSTLPQDRGDYLIAAVFAEDGGRLRWKGDMGVNPIASTGVVSLEGVHLSNMLELVQGLALPVNINQGDIKASFDYHFSLPQSLPTLEMRNVNLTLDALAGEMQDGAQLSLAHTSLSIPSLLFVKSKQPELHLEQIGYTLDEVVFKQTDQMHLTVKNATANLPKLDMLMATSPELVFDQLNLAVSDIAYQHGQQFSVVSPKLAIENIGYRLSDNVLSVNQVRLADLALSETNVLVETATSGKAQQSSQLAILKQINLSQGEVFLNDKRGSIEQIQLTDLDSTVVRDQQGNLNWVTLLASETNSETDLESVKISEHSTAQNSSPWDMQVNAIKLNNADIHFIDRTATKPVNLDITQANMALENTSLDLTKPLPVKASFRVKQGGQFSAKGQLWPSPFKANLGLRLSQMSLKPFAPYVNQLALLKLNDGAVNLSGRLAMQQKQSFAMTYNGGFSIKQLSVVEEADDAPFLGWQNVSSKDVKFSLAPDQLHIGTLSLLEPSGKFIINADKSTNVQQILRQPSEPLADVVETPAAVSAVTEVNDNPVSAQPYDSLIKPAGMPAPKKQKEQTKVVVKQVSDVSNNQAEPFPVVIDRITVQNAKLTFADLSLITPFGTNIHSLNGVLNGLGTQADKVAQIELDGKVDEYGSARIRGALQPFQLTEFTDIKLAFTNLDMSKLTPYSGKFAGRRIDAGKLSVDLGYQIKDQQLVGDNKFIVNRIKLGERVDSPDAADLPLDLAIAILEDSDGVIDLDLPISGSLEDPEFSYGSIVWKAFSNIITKIVTAPFKALGKLFGGDGEDFDGIAFEAGVSEISPPEQEKLVKIAKALDKRRGLSLGIEPVFHQEADTAAMKQTIYRQQVAEIMELELVEGQKAGPVDLGNESAQKAIIKLHDQLTKKGFFKRMADKFDEPEDGYFEKAQAELIASIEVTEKDLLSLAQARGQAIYDALVQQGVDAARLSQLDSASLKDSQTIQVTLTLDVKQSSVQDKSEDEDTTSKIIPTLEMQSKS